MKADRYHRKIVVMTGSPYWKGIKDRKPRLAWDCEHVVTGRKVTLYDSNVDIAAACFDAAEGDRLHMLGLEYRNRTSWHVVGCETMFIDGIYRRTQAPGTTTGGGIYWDTRLAYLLELDCNDYDVLDAQLVSKPYRNHDNVPVITLECKAGIKHTLYSRAVELAINGFNAEYRDWVRLFRSRRSEHGESVWHVVARLS